MRTDSLQRFEELVLYSGQHVLLPLPEPTKASESGAGELGGLTPLRSPVEPPPRKFLTVHDAAEWIEKNWPEYDLEKVPEVPWHGER